MKRFDIHCKRSLCFAVTLAQLLGITLLFSCAASPATETPAGKTEPVSLYGEVPPQIDGLYWGMSREELIRTLNLQPGEYEVTEYPGSGNALYSYVQLNIPEKEIPTQQGASVPTTFSFYENKQEGASIGLTVSTVNIGVLPPQLRDAVLGPLIMETSDFQVKERPDAWYELEDDDSVASCLPEGLETAFWDYAANPGYPNDFTLMVTVSSVLQGPDLLPLLEGSRRYDLLLDLPVVKGFIGKYDNKTAYYELNGEFPAIFRMLSQNQNAAGHLPFDLKPCFDDTVYDCREAVGTRKAFVFMGLQLSSDLEKEKEIVFERNFYFTGIDVPAQRLVLQCSDEFGGTVKRGAVEWSLPEEAKRKELIEKLAQEFSQIFGEEGTAETNGGIPYQWKDDWDNSLYLQDDSETQTVRIVTEAGDGQ